MIVGRLEFISKYSFGATQRGVPFRRFVPMNLHLSPMIVASSKYDAVCDYVTVVRKIADGDPPRGELVRLLGPVGDFDAEADALLLHYEAPPRVHKILPPPLNDLAPGLVQGWDWICNIDPEGCGDIDDVISLRRLGSSATDPRLEFGIHIAAVATIVTPGTEADKAARTAGASFYQADRVTRHALPPWALDRASLRPGSIARPVVSLCGEWNSATGEVSVTNPPGAWPVTWIVNQRSYTYAKGSAALADGSDPWLMEFAKITEALRMAFDLRNENEGEDTGADANCHKCIDTAMIVYNLVAAEWLFQKGAGILRVQDAPGENGVWKASEYCQTGAARGHWGFGGRNYAQATSPLRRYVDLVNQRVLISGLGAGPEPGTEASLALEQTERGKAVRRHDRDFALLSAIHTAPTGIINATVISETHYYIDDWKCRMRMRCCETPGAAHKIGDRLTLEYCANMAMRCWKLRIAVRCAAVGAIKNVNSVESSPNLAATPL